MYLNIVDANSLGYAHLYARKDVPHGTIIGVLESIIKSLIYRSDVPYVLIWDDRAQWRYDLYPQYKSGRHLTPEQREIRALYESEQSLLRPILQCLPIIQLTPKGAEADDLAYQLSRCVQNMGYLTKLYTADTDWLCAVDKLVHWVNAKRPAEIITLDNFHQLTDFGKPAWVPMIKALQGDRSDDIVGVKNIGEKRALTLLQRFGDLQSILYAASDILNWSQEQSYYHPLSNIDIQNNIVRNYQLTNLANSPTILPEDVNIVLGENDYLSLMDYLDNLNIKLDKITSGMWDKYFNIYSQPAHNQLVTDAVQALGTTPLVLE